MRGSIGRVKPNGFAKGTGRGQQSLGLISIQQRDFEAAVFHLELAYDADPGHRGIRKTLGYAYAWTGQFDRAYLLHLGLPETAEEMKVYAWWWRERGRDDLGANAEWMATLLTP